MTDIKSDKESTKATPIPAPIPARPPKSGRGLASFALLVALGAAGGGGYLWYLWQQDQAAQANRLNAAVKQAIAQYDTQMQPLRTQLQELQALKALLDQARTSNQDLKGQLLGLTGDFQPLKNALELQKGENDILKGEMRLLREGYEADKEAIQKRKQELDSQLQQQQERLAKIDEQFKGLQLTSNGLGESLEALKLMATKGGDVNAFPLAEVDYLLRLADAKLRLERNLPTALLALEAAHQQIKSISESALVPMQTMIGETIGTVRGVKMPDFSGLAHKLVEMENQVTNLPLKIHSEVPDIKNRIKPATDVTVSEDADRPWWDRTGEAVWNQFKGIVVIRRVRSQAPPLIGMEEEFFLRQNLRLTLETMRLALLRSDAQSYQDSLALVNTWLEKYFDTQDARVTAFQAELKALQNVQFNVYIPDLTGLTQAFHQMLNQRQPIRPVSKASTPAATEQPATH